MTERLEKRLRGFTGIAATAIFIASCSTSADSNQTNKTFMPDTNPLYTPAEVIPSNITSPETQESSLELSKHAALDFWLGAFDYNKTYDQRPAYTQSASIATKSSNLNQWKADQVNNMINGQTSDETLQISWNDLFINYDPTNEKNGSADRYVGNLEIQKPNLTVQEIPLSNADIANGIKFHAKADVQYTERYQSIYYKGVLFGVPYTNLAEQKWITEEPKDSMPEFSSWQNANYGIELELLSNGKWKQVNEDTRIAQDFNFKGLLTPSASANPDNVMGVQTTIPCTNTGNPCLLIKEVPATN